MASFLKSIVRPKNWLIIITVLDLLALSLSYFSPFLHPKTSDWIPFFGLGYIVILGCTIIITFIWLLFRSRWIFVPILFLLLGGKLHFRVLALGSDDDRKARTELKITSYNVHLFDRYNSNFKESIARRNEIFSYLKSIDSDVYCFQEFYQQDKPTRFVTRDTLIQVLKTKDQHERFSHKQYKRQNFGVATFSKYPIIGRGDIVFEGSESTFNFAIFTDIVKNKDTFRVYNVHLQSIRLRADDYAIFAEGQKDTDEMKSRTLQMIQKIKGAYPIRAQQAKKVANHIKLSPYPVILCGDFNDTPLSYCYNQFNKLLNDSFRQTSMGIGATYVGKVPAGRIDYIFYDPILGARNFMIQEEPLSDHRAIHATIFTAD
ncbi:MAG: endonuclease/exonuclease/phosphatase family protein [Crocinitomicaceae bacterium]